MRCKYLYLFVFMFLMAKSFAQKNINDYIKLINLNECYSNDLIETDTIVDIKNGYLEIIDARFTKVVLAQASIFKNADSTVSIAVTGLYADMQCSAHRTMFFEYSEKTGLLKKIDANTILPKIELDALLKNSKAIKIISSYLDEIKQKYLGNEASMADVFNEIYDLHFILDAQAKGIKVTLDVCDYIPVNLVPIKESDWRKIETDFKNVMMSYDGRMKKFVLVD